MTCNRASSVSISETNYFASDTLGTVRVATGNNGSVIDYEDYDVFGNPYERAGTLAGDDLMYAYTGKTWDAVTGLSNYGFRDYAPQLARFTTVDPIRDGNNWYAYVHNDPVNLRDLWGLADVYFLYTYKSNSKNDQKMKSRERKTIDDDIEYLKSQGLSVVVVEAATRTDIIDAVQDPEAKLIVTSGHGYNPDDLIGIQTSNGGVFSPKDIDSDMVSKQLQTVIFENCYQGDNEDKWEEAFGNNVDVVGWHGTTSVLETKSFNSYGLFDRQDKSLKDYEEDVVETSQKLKNK